MQVVDMAHVAATAVRATCNSQLHVLNTVVGAAYECVPMCVYVNMWECSDYNLFAVKALSVK